MHKLPVTIFELRKVLGLSQYQIAFFLNVSQSAYSHWETGETLPRWKNLQAIATFYQLSLPELIFTSTDELVLRVFLNKYPKSSLKEGK